MRLLRIPRRLMVNVAIVAAIAAALGFAAPASAHTGPRTWYAVAGVQSNNMSVQGMAFLPHELWIDQGDTVVWSGQAAEIHTVTFTQPGQTLPPFTGALNQVTQTSNHSYDGHSFYNSGLLINVAAPGTYTSYSLTFSVTGDFTYYCWVHPNMIGIVHVRPAGTHYPFSQEDINEQIASSKSSILHDGYHLADYAWQHSSYHNVFVGNGDGLATQMRFFPHVISVSKGDWVTFTNHDVMEPHTVSYGSVPADDPAPIGSNPVTFTGQTISSGFIFYLQTYKVQFNATGTYTFFCALHEEMGMVLTVQVHS